MTEDADREALEETILVEATELMPPPVEGNKSVAGNFKGDIDQNPDGTLKPTRQIGGAKKLSCIGLTHAKRVIDEILQKSENLQTLQKKLQEWFDTDPIAFVFDVNKLFDKQEKAQVQERLPLRVIHEIKQPDDRDTN